MKRVILLITGLMLILNLVLGMIFSIYPWFNVFMTSLCMILTAGVVVWIGEARLADGFKYSLLVLTPIAGIIETALAAFVPNHIDNNWALALLLVFMALEIVFIAIIHFVSNK